MGLALLALAGLAAGYLEAGHDDPSPPKASP
jgi:hypothetical protein